MSLFTPDGHLLPLDLFCARLSHGADPNEVLSIQQGDELMSYVPLLEAVKDTDFLPHLKALLANPRLSRKQADYELRTAVHLAASYENDQALGMLLKAGFPCDTRDTYEATPLHYAALNFTHNCVLQLLGAGADPNTVSSEGRTPLHECLMLVVSENSCVEDKMRLLLAAGANPNLADSRGNTVLHKAAMDGNAVAVRLLLAKGANARTRNFEGDRPVDIAQRNVHLYQSNYGQLREVGLQSLEGKYGRMRKLGLQSLENREAIFRLLVHHDRACLQAHVPDRARPTENTSRPLM